MTPKPKPKAPHRFEALVTCHVTVEVQRFERKGARTIVDWDLVSPPKLTPYAHQTITKMAYEALKSLQPLTPKDKTNGS